MLASQDTHVLVAVLDPNPINYFYPTFNYYNFIKFPINITGRNYWKALETGPKDSPADAILFNSEVVVWIPLSTMWAIWGERSYGICILAFASDRVRLSVSDITKTWKSAESALDSFVSFNFQNQKIPKEFSDSIVLNYSNKSCT